MTHLPGFANGAWREVTLPDPATMPLRIREQDNAVWLTGGAGAGRSILFAAARAGFTPLWATPQHHADLETFLATQRASGHAVAGYVAWGYRTAVAPVSQTRVAAPHHLGRPTFSQADLRGFAAVAIWDHATGKGYAASLDDRAWRSMSKMFERPTDELPHGPATVLNAGRQDEYELAVAKTRDAIINGAFIQANIARVITIDSVPSPGPWFAQRLRRSPVNFAAFMLSETHAVASLSPERFVKWDGRAIESWPIKGTARKTAFPDDPVVRDALWNSAKDRAELAMVIDVIRNDLNRICERGSVQLDPDFRVVDHRDLYHLESRVVGQVREGVGFAQILAAMFPGGSITGAPRIAAMNWIDQVETAARGVYTGTIGWTTGDHGDWNIAIRTAQFERVRRDVDLWDGVYHTGGGITSESDPRAEWEETVTKSLSVSD
jgi:anthranilate/para-aminobenzoate synthase component I